MANFFCAALSQQMREDLIGTASIFQTYVLIESPPPWATNALESKQIPDSLKRLIQEVQANQPSVRFLLIAADSTRPKRRVLILRQIAASSRGYSAQEFQISHLNQAAPLIHQHLSASLPASAPQYPYRDLLVCTHGSHDKCCAKFGYPFYRQLTDAVRQLSLPHLRVWQVSHIGGHRFAPTLIDFPEGRYYGALNVAATLAILQRQGNLSSIRQTYRGWGKLPKLAQILERELLLNMGWDWFEQSLDASVTPSDTGCSQVELTSQSPQGQTLLYRADIVEDEAKTLYLPGSCGSKQVSRFVKYRVENLLTLPQASPPAYIPADSALPIPNTAV